MAQTTKKVDFIGGKINETPSGGAAVTVLDSIADSLANAAESSGPMRFNLAASATDVALSLGNVATAKVVVLLTDGAVSVKLNGSADALAVNKSFILFGTISGITASNPSSSEARGITLYCATDTN